MKTTFSVELNENDFFRWVEMKTTFSAELNENDFFRWVEWERLFQMNWLKRLFHMSWLKTAFSKLYTLNHQLFLFTHLKFEMINKLVYIILKKNRVCFKLTRKSKFDFSKKHFWHRHFELVWCRITWNICKCCSR